jgi:tRNA nucleotidyltransferase/poly(A) polymerase
VPVYLVGGAVRDALRGNECAHDFDFALAEGFDELVAAFARTQRGKVIPWDVDQKRIVFRQGNERVTVDFSRMHQPDILCDLHQRDFTVNAMALAVHASDTELIDPLGGQADLASRCLRMCSEGAFEADPLRMLRAVRFARQLSCEIEPRTQESMRLNSALITRPARERIKRELFMILHGPAQEQSLRELLACGLLQRLLPDILLMSGVRQSAPHEHVLLEHCLLTVRFLEEVQRMQDTRFDGVRAKMNEYLHQSFEEGVTMAALLSFVALLHDIGKPACACDDNGRMRFYGHDTAGAAIIRRIARETGLGRKAQQVLGCLVENHMRILQMSQLENLSERAKLRFVRDCGTVAPGVCLLAIADSLATGSMPEFQDSSQRVRDIARELCGRFFASQDMHETAPLLTGADVINALGRGPGPHVGRILRQAAQLERNGTLQNREAAVAWLHSLKSTD